MKKPSKPSDIRSYFMALTKSAAETKVEKQKICNKNKLGIVLKSKIQKTRRIETTIVWSDSDDDFKLSNKTAVKRKLKDDEQTVSSKTKNKTSTLRIKGQKVDEKSQSVKEEVKSPAKLNSSKNQSSSAIVIANSTKNDSISCGSSAHEKEVPSTSKNSSDLPSSSKKSTSTSISLPKKRLSSSPLKLDTDNLDDFKLYSPRPRKKSKESSNNTSPNISKEENENKNSKNNSTEIQNSQSSSNSSGNILSGDRKLCKQDCDIKEVSTSNDLNAANNNNYYCEDEKTKDNNNDVSLFETSYEENPNPITTIIDKKNEQVEEEMTQLTPVLIRSDHYRHSSFEKTPEKTYNMSNNNNSSCVEDFNSDLETPPKRINTPSQNDKDNNNKKGKENLNLSPTLCKQKNIPNRKRVKRVLDLDSENEGMEIKSHSNNNNYYNSSSSSATNAVLNLIQLVSNLDLLDSSMDF